MESVVERRSYLYGSSSDDPSPFLGLVLVHQLKTPHILFIIIIIIANQLLKKRELSFELELFTLKPPYIDLIH